ncbi:hypothetical protein H5410_042187, partial [Solanum commersonii]
HGFLVIQNSDLLSQLVLRGKSAHFQGQTSPRAGKHPVLPIFVCVHGFLTLAIDLVGPDGQTDPFSMLNKPQSSYVANWSRRANQPIFKVKQAPEQANPPFCRFFVCYSPWIFGDREFRFIESVSPDGQTGPFSRSNEPQSNKLVPMGKPVYFIGQMSPSKPLFCPFFNSNVIFTKFFYGSPLRPYLWSQLVRTGKPAHFQGNEPQSSYGANLSRRANRPIFKVKQALEQLLSQLVPTGKSGHFQGQTNPEQTSVKTLDIESIGPDGQTGPFLRSNEPRATFHGRLKTLAIEPISPNGKTSPFSRSNKPQS